MRIYKSIFFVLVVSVIAGLYMYYVPNNTQAQHAKFRVVCTTSMLADAVRSVGGEHVEVIGLMGPGVDPHLYRAREGDVRRLAYADLVLYHGLHLEGRMTDILAAMQAYVPTMAVCASIPKEHLRESDFEGLYDPHVWHDVRLWMYVITSVRDVLMQYDSEHAEYYYRAAQDYSDDLAVLHESVLAQIATIPASQRFLVTAHDAFAYFGAAYGLEVIALQGISTESDISTRDVIDLATFIVDHKVATLFLESSIPPRNVEAVQQAVRASGWDVQIGDELYSDALGDVESGADTYIRMITHNVDAIVKGATP